MELLVHRQSGCWCFYDIFSEKRAQAKLTIDTPQSLKDLCRRTVIKETTLRRLKDIELHTLPPLIRHDLTILSTQDFVEIRGPCFFEVFDIYMYNRALTYRVRCMVDGGVYMATHAGTCDSVEHNSEAFWQWVQLSHPNLMCAYAVALDIDTSNVFLITDLPDVSLWRLEIVLAPQGLCFPEYFLWKVAEQLSSVIMYTEERHLSFGRFELKDVYLVGDRLQLENKLAMKPRVNPLPVGSCAQSLFLGDMVNIGGSYEMQANTSSSASVMSLGVVLTRLASIALTDQETSLTSTDVSELEITSSRIGDDVPFFDGFRPPLATDPKKYSSEFLDLLVSLNSRNLPQLSAIHAKAVEMMALLMATEHLARLDVGDEVLDCATQ